MDCKVVLVRGLPPKSEGASTNTKVLEAGKPLRMMIGTQIHFGKMRTNRQMVWSCR